MPVFVAGKYDHVTFAPVGEGPITLPTTAVYVAEVRGGRVAFVETVFDADADELNRLKTGRVGRLSVTHPEGGYLDAHRSIPACELDGVIDCVSHGGTVYNMIRKAFIFVEIIPPEVR